MGLKMVEEKSFFEEFKEDKPESFEEEVFVVNKSKKPIYMGTILVFILILFFGFNLMNKVEIPDMTTWKVSEVGAWSKKNDITLIGKQSYSLVIDNDMVIKQSIIGGEKVKRNSSLEVEFSKGANPDENIVFPEIKTMTLEDIQKWVKVNKLSGINIQYENSNSIEKSTVIAFKFVDGDSSSFKRKNRVKIMVSKGSATLTETLSMPELYGKTKQEVLKWAVDNSIQVTVEEEYSDYIEENYVISQDVPKDNKFNRTETVTVNISIGTAISVPSFLKLTSAEASTLAGLYDLRLFIKSVNNDGETDRIVYQDVKALEHAKKNDIITLHVSKKSTVKTMPSFIGLSKVDASEMATAYNFKVVYKAVQSIEKNHMVLSQSVLEGRQINESEVVTLTISNGSIVVPNFSGMGKSKAQTLTEDLGLKVVFNTTIDVHRKKDTVFKQDLNVGDTVDHNTRITLDIAENNGVKVINLTTMTKTEAEFWAKTKGFNLRVVDVYSASIKKNKLFDQNYTNIFLPEKEPIIVYRSLGKVSLGNMIGQNKQEIETWIEGVNSKGANISVEYRNSTSTVYAKDTITHQVPKNSSLELDGKVVFTISSSKVKPQSNTAEVDNMTEAAFIKWCNRNRITYKISDVYSSTIKKGYIFGDNIKIGLAIGQILNVKKSIGSVAITSFIGQPKSTFEQWLSGVNSKGGRIKVTYINQAGGVKDSVVSQSITAGYLDVGNVITVTLNTGF